MNLASDIMTDDVSIAEADAPIHRVMELMENEKISHVPIVDKGKLVGVVSSRDLHELFNPRYWDTERQEYFDQLMREPISELMSSPARAVEPEASLRRVIDEMVEAHVGAIVVHTEDEGVLGIISYVDLLKALRYAA